MDVTEKRNWDKRLTWDECLNKLNFEINAWSGNVSVNMNRVRLTYLSVMLTQLYNGCRVGEAVEAVRGFYSSGCREVWVRVEKRRDDFRRLVLVPERVDRGWLLPEALNVSRVKTYACRLGVNTHTLRYAFITRLAQQGVNPLVLSKITGHKNVNILTTYIQMREAEAVLRGFNT
ncbi:tyrosine-type recombinase/integrase [Candidatus Bathyarchaeota archaeon A05DMB-2]|nr:tyrosine-type recombinase/integrase [Candidatus Bathyarchaeota archaeon A05DMB-2]